MGQWRKGHLYSQVVKLDLTVYVFYHFVDGRTFVLMKLDI
jgi:hypothetical protein